MYISDVPSVYEYVFKLELIALWITIDCIFKWYIHKPKMKELLVSYLYNPAIPNPCVMITNNFKLHDCKYL